MDECNRNNGGCDISATCINVPGSVRCVCDDGYTGDGYRCRGKCDISATCINVPGSVRCVCDDGYAGDGYRCRG